MATIDDNVKAIKNAISAGALKSGSDPNTAVVMIAVAELLGSIAKSLEKIAANSGGEP